ncbi:MAG TPA: DUF4254 domain-containing protein [Candidatus Coprenecus stercoripullorum]|nr:DUF4254 domain-containing protein [Candidatus Coprenecus stercoripullorum]
MSFSEDCNRIFARQVESYHEKDDVDAPLDTPYQEGTLENLLYRKNWIDTVQWHLEDIIREPSIEPAEALAVKRRIDKSNQDRTDLVEKIDEWFYARFSKVPVQGKVSLNTETPAWAIDRLSILALKIYHMDIESRRLTATEEHRARCKAKLDILLEQKGDLSGAIDELISDLESGRKRMKLYRQMKMYNDPSLNPVLYGKD